MLTVTKRLGGGRGQSKAGGTELTGTLKAGGGGVYPPTPLFKRVPAPATPLALQQGGQVGG